MGHMRFSQISQLVKGSYNWGYYNKKFSIHLILDDKIQELKSLSLHQKVSQSGGGGEKK